MEIVELMGLSSLIQIIAGTSFEIVLAVIIITMLAEIRQDSKNEFIKKISIPYTAEIVMFYLLIFMYNFTFILSLIVEAYPWAYSLLLKRVSVFIYYLVGAFLTVFFLQVIKVDIVAVQERKRLEKLCRIFQLCQIPLLILLLITPFTNVLYYIDENKCYLLKEKVENRQM